MTDPKALTPEQAAALLAEHLQEDCPGYRMDPQPSSLWPGEESEIMS